MRIEMGEYKKAYAPGMMETHGLGPCLGIAIYEPWTRSGYVGHLCKSSSLPEMISEISLQKREKMRVTLAGMAFCTSGTDAADRRLIEYLAQRRERTMAYLQSCGFEHIEQRFSPDNTATSMRLDLNNGTVEISVKSLNELNWNMG